LRSDQEFSEFTRIKSYINLSSAVQIVSDSFFTSVSRYFYRIGALNSCGAVIDTSNLATNILLEGQNDGESNILHWNSYRNFPLGLSGYEIYRLDTAASAELIGTTAGQCTFTDNLTSIYGQNFSGKINYLIKAIENGGANYSFSNYCPVNAKSEIWMPNAFTPNGDGKNDVLMPRLNFIPENYLMLIYDRFGIVAFTSKSPDIGWDGRIGGGKFAPEGVYVVHIQYSSFNGQKINKTESVSVFYPR
jgi:gliding motility-associated-like protein